MSCYLIETGASRSFPDPEMLRRDAARDIRAADTIVVIGDQVGTHTSALREWADKSVVLLELGNECLGVHTGESAGREGSNVLGFARFRLGTGEPTELVELVRQPATGEAAIAAAVAFFEGLDLKVAVCRDFSGRIIDRLIRPYFNAALRRLDEQLATADDLDTTLRLGLGYPEGPIALLERTGLAEHDKVSRALFEAYGEPAYAPARRAAVAAYRDDIE